MARIGRQFHDIWALLGTPEVLDFLTDKPLVSEVLASCYEISEAFTPDPPIPRDGFAASPAFDPTGSLETRLRAEHDAAIHDLYYGTDAPPTFESVLERVQANRSLLDIEATS